MPTNANTNNLFTGNLKGGDGSQPSAAAGLMSKYNLNSGNAKKNNSSATAASAKQQRTSRILLVGSGAENGGETYVNTEAYAKQIQQKIASMPRPEQLEPQQKDLSSNDFSDIASSNVNARPLRNAYKAQKEAKFMEKYGHQALYDEALDASSPDEDAIEAQAKDYEEKMDMNKAGGTGADKRTPSHQRKPKSVRM